jgi:hypothetical protein
MNPVEYDQDSLVRLEVRAGVDAHPVAEAVVLDPVDGQGGQLQRRRGRLQQPGQREDVVGGRGGEQHAVGAALEHVQHDRRLFEVRADGDQLAFGAVRRGQHDLQRDLGRVGEVDHGERQRDRGGAGQPERAVVAHVDPADGVGPELVQTALLGHLRERDAPDGRREDLEQFRVVADHGLDPGVDGCVHDGLELSLRNRPEVDPCELHATPASMIG